jgi:hypothetical protein
MQIHFSFPYYSKDSFFHLHIRVMKWLLFVGCALVHFIIGNRRISFGEENERLLGLFGWWGK